MRICIVGAGKMGSFLADTMCLLHEVAIYDVDVRKLQYVFNTRRLTSLEEIREFNPELLINAVTLKYTMQTFEEVLPYVSDRCMLSYIASVKTGLLEFYKRSGRPFVSTHPMFGPTFAHLNALSQKKSIIPFVSTFVFAAVIKHQDAPGTTSKRHMNYLTRIRKNVND